MNIKGRLALPSLFDFGGLFESLLIFPLLLAESTILYLECRETVPDDIFFCEGRFFSCTLVEDDLLI